MPRVAARTAWITALSVAAALTGFAANSLLTRAAVGPGLIDAVSFTTLRLATGAAALAALVAFSRPPAAHVPSTPSTARTHAVAAAAALAGYAYAFAFAYTRIDAGIGALLLFGAVQITMTGWGLARGDRPRPVEWLGLAGALAGLVVLTRPGLSAPDPTGAALMAAAGACWGAYSLLGRRLAAPLRATLRNFAAATAIGVVIALAVTPRHATARGALLATASGAVASGLGYALWYRALPALSRFRAALVQLAVPVVTAAGAWLLLDEPVTARLVASAALILGGILLACLAGPVGAGTPPGR